MKHCEDVPLEVREGCFRVESEWAGTARTHRIIRENIIYNSFFFLIPQA